MNIDEVIPSERFTNTNLVALYLYFPVGFLLALLRLFLTFNFACSQFVFNVVCSKSNVLRRAYEKVLLAILGVVVLEKNNMHSKAILVSNKLSNVDGFFISILCNCFVFQKGKLSRFLQNFFRLHSSESSPNQILSSGSTVIVYPEPCPGSGKGLFKFSQLPASVADMQLQPMAVKLKRFLMISGTTLESSMWSDLFWMYFSPINIYEVSYLPIVRKQEEQTIKQLGDDLQKKVAEELQVPHSNYDEADIRDYIHRKHFEARKPQQHLRTPGPSSPMIREMVQQVKDVLPHVPTSAILKDIERTRNVDVTVTNFLERVVTFVPEPQPASSNHTSSFNHPSSSKTPSTLPANKTISKHSTFAEKKAAFLSQARENYIKKHGLAL